jgi:hypothetical protein
MGGKRRCIDVLHPLEEEWRPAPGFPNYEVSSFGRVRRAATGKLLRPYPNRRGYRRNGLYVEGRRYQPLVHRLVCEAWHGPPPEGRPLACHANDIKTSNRQTNLYWGSYQQNAADYQANKHIPVWRRKRASQ